MFDRFGQPSAQLIEKFVFVTFSFFTSRVMHLSNSGFVFHKYEMNGMHPEEWQPNQISADLFKYVQIVDRCGYTFANECSGTYLCHFTIRKMQRAAVPTLLRNIQYILQEDYLKPNIIMNISTPVSSNETTIVLSRNTSQNSDSDCLAFWYYEQALAGKSCSDSCGSHSGTLRFRNYMDFPASVQNQSTSSFNLSDYDCQEPWPELGLFVPIKLRVNDLRVFEWEHILLRGFLFNWHNVSESKTSINLIVDGEMKNTSLLDVFVLEPLRGKYAELGSLMPNITVKFHTHEPNVYREGYDRQQYLAFKADNFISSEFIGFMDTDAFIHSYVDKLSIFDSQNRPIIHGRIGYYGNDNLGQFRSKWAEATSSILGMPEVVNCMSYFPIVVKATHLKDLREHLMKRWNKSVFNQTFMSFTNAQMIWGPRKHRMYSQYNIMCTYLWWHKRDEYFWSIADASPKWNGKNPPPGN